MTSTRSTIPAPPPNGVSSTAPPLSGVVARGSTASNVCPSASALATWRCPRNQSNHPGNSVKTSISTQEPHVHVDPARRRGPASGSRRAPAGSAGRRPRSPRRRAARPSGRRRRSRASPSTTRQPDEVVRPELALLQRGRLGDGHAQLGAAQRLGVLAGGAALEPEDRPRVGARAADDLDPAAVDHQRACGPRAARGPRVPRETSRRARAAGRRSRRGGARYSTMSTRTRRLSLTAAALTTVRSACAVRPPRPMTCP